MKQNKRKNDVSIGYETLCELKKSVSDFSASTNKSIVSIMSGAYKSKLRGRGIDFDQVRPYLVGDDIRSIDWRITARTSQPHTKLFFDEKERPIFIIVEQSQRLFFSSGHQFKSVVAAKLAAMLSWWGLEHHDRVGGLVFNDIDAKLLSPKLNKANVLQFIKYISEYNQALCTENNNANSSEQTMNLASAINMAKLSIKPGMLLCLIVDERSLDESSHKVLTRLSYNNDLVLFPIYDPIDHELPKQSALKFIQNGKTITLNGNNSRVQQAYKQIVDAREEQWQRLTSSSKARRYSISTNDLVLQPIEN